MYTYLLIFHSWIRWIALIALLLTIFLAFRGFSIRKKFSAIDNQLRHWTATLFHIQLIIGVLLLVKSPIIQYFWSDPNNHFKNIQLSFFSLFHPLMMLLAIIIVTIGSAKAKRKTNDRAKYQTILIWYSIGLLLLFFAIPWSFSPFVSRPDFRFF